MTKLRRNELEALSLKVYGSKSRYKTIMNKGQKETLLGTIRILYLSEEEIETQMKGFLEGRSDKTMEQALADLTAGSNIEVK